MKLTKMGHSCVRLEKDGRTLTIDPGSYSEMDAAVGSDAVLITHEHADHLDRERLAAAIAARPGVEVWTTGSVADSLDDVGATVHRVGHEDSFTAAGFDVKAVGELHAVMHPDIPVIANVGFLVEDAVFHPGDAFTVPGVPIRVLLAPISAPFMRLADVIDYIRQVAPEQAYGTHDGMLNEKGVGLLDRMLGGGVIDLGAPYERLLPGDSRDVP